ncbi:ninjurin C isoform X2 [Leptinotarsa decemlineata]|uniref:ninjurin C isoform X2 n=1 Tax=Leptinotarsa decemlineata TaxID=7539 RepID=UPI003D307BA0
MAQRTDGNIISEIIKKTLDVNKYATKKTIAQGLLDVALLTANASQLKYVLQVGEKHEFYVLMLCLIIISILLQVVQGCICILLGSSLNLNKEDHQDNANTANNVVLCINVILMVLNILINAFDMKEADDGSHVTNSNITTTESSLLFR